MRPPLVVRRFVNPLAMRLAVAGTRALGVRGRRSGLMRWTPVIPVEHDGETYLVSPRGDTQWVRNLRAAGRGELGRWGSARPVRVIEVAPQDRGPVIEAYRRRAGRAVASFFEEPPDPAAHPVFRVRPTAGEPSRARGAAGDRRP